MSEQTTTICNKLGLHARAASKLANTANQFSSKVTVSCNGKAIDAKSIMSLMLLAACKGTDITITAEGSDADLAVASVVELINNRFDEDE
ncbi:HPr family phosphocarrier protein [Marinagarivorans cellulosilyticus]|uniref:Phosphocarrier protein n=1 Tax=Marinagarivorans cellulosilyticus TaxID=2721545 RepID=A0AAN2BK31_9GAMM|nr:HPr family phosphocarrier protein [Marinagarivorans cellulosilyticus]BCD97576.1 phosphocarrier protein [Marinagarivorans cellulosilyticus]